MLNDNPFCTALVLPAPLLPVNVVIVLPVVVLSGTFTLTVVGIIVGATFVNVIVLNCVRETPLVSVTLSSKVNV